jgi:hypothetical protein
MAMAYQAVAASLHMISAKATATATGECIAAVLLHDSHGFLLLVCDVCKFAR